MKVNLLFLIFHLILIFLGTFVYLYEWQPCFETSRQKWKIIGVSVLINLLCAVLSLFICCLISFKKRGYFLLDNKQLIKLFYSTLLSIVINIGIHYFLIKKMSNNGDKCFKNTNDIFWATFL